MSKRILGIIFIIIASIMTLLFMKDLPKIMGNILVLFTSKMSAYQAGTISGFFTYQVLHVFATFTLWKYGLKWVKKPLKAIS